MIYETNEVKERVPENIRPVLWFMLEELDAPSTNHCFELSIEETDGNLRQHIIHTQRDTEYCEKFSFKCPNPICMSVYIVGFGANDWLMLLQP